MLTVLYWWSRRKTLKLLLDHKDFFYSSWDGDFDSSYYVMQFSQWSCSCEISPGPGLACVERGYGDESWQWPLLLAEGSSDAAEKAETQQVKIHSIFPPVNGTLLEATGNIRGVGKLAAALLLRFTWCSSQRGLKVTHSWNESLLKRNGCCLGPPLSVSLTLPSCCE